MKRNKRHNLPDTSPSIPTGYLMVRPTPEGFGFNPQNPDNHYAHPGDDPSIPMRALAEFDSAAKLLRSNDIPLHIIGDTPTPSTPDSIFPNNCFSTHPDGTLVLYPMRAENRRSEAAKLLPAIAEQFVVDDTKVIDLRNRAENGQYLEGTGSIIFDHPNKMAFAAYSKRTDQQLFEELCDTLGYTPVGFAAHDNNGHEIYHTNVLMSLGLGYAAVALEAIDTDDRTRVLNAILKKTGRSDIITLTQEQVSQFAGNILQLYTRDGQPRTVMSTSAFAALTDGERDYISRHGRSLFDAQGNPIEKPDPKEETITTDIPTVQKYGGGGIRCMIAEMHLAPRPAGKADKNS